MQMTPPDNLSVPGHVLQTEVGEHILDLCYKYGTQRGHKIEILAISPSKDPESIEFNPRLRPGFQVERDLPPSFPAKVWLHLDTIPMIISVKEQQFSLQARAVAVVEKALDWLSPLSSSTLKIKTAPDRAVLVDANYQAFIYDIAQQARLTSPRLWDSFTRSGQHLLDKKLKIVSSMGYSSHSVTNRVTSCISPSSRPLHPEAVWLSCAMDSVASGTRLDWTSSGMFHKVTLQFSTSPSASSTTYFKAWPIPLYASQARTSSCSRSGLDSTLRNSGVPRMAH